MIFKRKQDDMSQYKTQYQCLLEQKCISNTSQTVLPLIENDYLVSINKVYIGFSLTFSLNNP